MKASLSQVEAIRAAASTFIERYQALPGDYSEGNNLAINVGADWSALCDGSTDVKWDGDGVIEGNGVADETLIFWQHLSAANMIKGIQVDDVPSTKFGIGLPAAHVGGGYTVDFEENTAKTTHWITLGDGRATPVGVVDSQMAREMDAKVDDDRPQSGSVRTSTAGCTVKQQLSQHRAAGNTMFFSSHIFSDVEELCDRIGIVHMGRLAYLGTPEELKQLHGATSLEKAFLVAIEQTELAG